MPPGALASYYDRLGRWNRVAHAFGYGGGHSTLTVHRALADPAAGGSPTFTRIHDIIFEQVSGLVPRRMIDAGCGLGGTMIACVERFPNLSAVGLTLSASQAAHATEAAADKRLDGRIQVLVRSFDDPPAGPFDLIVAIESLAHSADPRATVAALARVLAPGGLFVIVDDMPEPGTPATADFETFTRGWNCPVPATAAMHRQALTTTGLVVAAERDLTPECRLRTARRISQLMRLNRIASRIVPSDARHVLEAHLGGLALERLLRTGAVRYRLLIARRPAVQVS